MIIVRLVGGLGNQLFQYAAARRLAYVKNVPLKLDISGFDSCHFRKYNLCYFNIQENFANNEEVCLFNKELNRSKISRFISEYIPCRKQDFKLIKERHFHFDARLLKVGSNVLLEGYWQSEKYFFDISDIIRNEFTFKNNPDSINSYLAEEMSANNSVSLHIRRGDYVTNHIANSYHGVSPVSYYNDAIEKISSHISNPHFYIFTDDPDWVRSNFHLDYPYSLLSHNDTDKSYEDLRLMTLCNANIIANSSFSWWGAWLNPMYNKIVIAPKRWFNRDDIETKDLIPDGWLSL